jgi:hypothetical protein
MCGMAEWLYIIIDEDILYLYVYYELNKQVRSEQTERNNKYIHYIDRVDRIDRIGDYK